jgi:hypothetical protein
MPPLFKGLPGCFLHRAEAEGMQERRPKRGIIRVLRFPPRRNDPLPAWILLADICFKSAPEDSQRVILLGPLRLRKANGRPEEVDLREHEQAIFPIKPGLGSPNKLLPLPNVPGIHDPSDSPGKSRCVREPCLHDDLRHEQIQMG